MPCTMQDDDALSNICNHDISKAEEQGLKINHVAVAASDPLPIFITQNAVFRDKARIAVDENSEHSGVTVGESGVEEMFIGQSIITNLIAAMSALDAWGQFLETSAGLQQESRKASQAMLEEGRSLLRLSSEKMKTKWATLMIRLKNNLKNALPSEWRTYPAIIIS